MKKLVLTTMSFFILILISACGGNFLSFRTYEVSFVTNGGSEIAPISVEIGTPIDFSSATSTYDGYKLEGWYLDSKFTQEITEEFLVFQNLTVYAKWKLDLIQLADIFYEFSGSVLTWNYEATNYSLYIDDKLIKEFSVNTIDLFQYKESLTNNKSLLITTTNDTTDKTYALLNLEIKYESNSILLYNKFLVESGYNSIEPKTDVEYTINNWTILNSNFLRDSGSESLKLIYSKDNIKDSKATLLFDNTNLDNVTKVMFNAKTQSLNELKIVVVSKNTNERYEKIVVLSTKYKEYVIELDHIFDDTEIEISLILLPSSLETENSGVYIRDFSLLSNNEKYIITDNNK